MEAKIMWLQTLKTMRTGMRTTTLLTHVTMWMCLHLIMPASGSQPANVQFTTDICRHSGKDMQCSGNDVISIGDVRCLPSNYSCPEASKIRNICDNQKSCTTVGLRQQMMAYCQNDSNNIRTVIVSFRCVKALVRPPCKTNLCSSESEGLHCKIGSVLHIAKATCNHGDQECSWKVYQTLYALCEGQRSCYASGLRELVPRQTCGDKLIQTANLFVDYICIKDLLVDSHCTRSTRVMLSPFGVVTSPGFPNNPNGNPNECYWAVEPSQNQIVEVTVHVAYSKEFTSSCAVQHLQVTFVNCNTGQVKTEAFCWRDQVNSVRRSCGRVYIKSWSYHAGEDRGSRFLVSYQVKDKTQEDMSSYTFNMQQCTGGKEVLNVTSAVPYTSAGENSSSVKSSRSINTNLSTSQKDSKKPWRFLTIIKIVVVNAFLFIIGLCLLIAVIYVCYRYKKLDKAGKYNIAPQSDTDSGRRTMDTPLQTFSEEIESNSPRDTSIQSFSSQREQSQVYASLSEDPYATVTDSSNMCEINNKQNGCLTGTTSFRPKATNPYSSYSSLDYDVPVDVHEQYNQSKGAENPNHHYSSPSHTSVHTSPHHLNYLPPTSPAHGHAQINNDFVFDPTSGDEDFPPPPPELTTSYTDDEVPHYIINDTEYAIVQKPKRKPDGTARFQSYSPSSASSPLKTAEASFSPETGVLTHHQCMLSGQGHNQNHPQGHCSRIPPFVPPKPKLNGNKPHW